MAVILIVETKTLVPANMGTNLHIKSPRFHTVMDTYNTQSKILKQLCLPNCFFLIFGNVSPFCSSTRLFLVDPSLGCYVSCMQCDTCWPLGSHRGRQASSTHVLWYVFASIDGLQIHDQACPSTTLLHIQPLQLDCPRIQE